MPGTITETPPQPRHTPQPLHIPARTGCYASLYVIHSPNLGDFLFQLYLGAVCVSTPYLHNLHTYFSKHYVLALCILVGLTPPPIYNYMYLGGALSRTLFLAPYLFAYASLTYLRILAVLRHLRYVMYVIAEHILGCFPFWQPRPLPIHPHI